MNPKQMGPVDRLVHEYSKRLQKIYDERTAGDYTFVGVLGDFLNDLTAVSSSKARQVTADIPPPLTMKEAMDLARTLGMTSRLFELMSKHTKEVIDIYGDLERSAYLTKLSMISEILIRESEAEEPSGATEEEAGGEEDTGQTDDLEAKRRQVPKPPRERQ